MKVNGEDLSNIEKNVNEIEYYNSFTKIFKKIFIITISIIIVFTLFEVISLYKMKSEYNLNKNILNNGQKYEKSVYIKYKDKIYACVYGESYQLDDVDIESFKVIDSTDYSDSYIAVDKNSVYFGNIPAPDLNPEKFEVIGNGYYTDGKNNYFCQRYSEKNENLSKFEYVKYFLLMGDRPQRYIYPFKKVEMNRSLEVIKDINFFTTDGKKVYYKGEILENSDINTFGVVDSNSEYFFDKENVYYKTKILPVKNSGNLEIVSIDQGHNFLYDRRNGYVFLEDYPFDMEKAPYRVLGNKGNHIYDLLFVNNEGVYYYDTKSKKQKRAGDNIFIGNIEEISPNVFTDDENIYYFHAYSIWSKRKGGGGGLASRNTEIYYLDKKEGWKKITDVGSGVYGSIWQKGDKYYYFDNLGISQLIDNAIYEITDMGTLEELRSSQNDRVIKELIEDKKLMKVEGEKKIKIVEKYKGNWDYFMIFFILCIFIVPTIFNACKKIISRRIDNEAGRF